MVIPKHKGEFAATFSQINYPGGQSLTVNGNKLVSG
jgi:hypothetical protein